MTKHLPRKDKWGRERMSITGTRNDALTVLLNSLGYQPLVLAKTGLKAPYVYKYKDTKLEEIGSLSDLLLPEAGHPELDVHEVPEVTRKETDKKNGSAFAGFLGDALRAIGITTPPRINADAAREKEFTFSFENVTSEGLSYLQTSKLIRQIDKQAVADLLSDDLEAGYIHIAYDYLFAGSLSMRDASSSAAGAGAKGLEIKQILDVGASVKVEKTSEDTWSFKSDASNRAAFACKIGWLEKKGTELKLHIHEDSGESFLADEGEPQPYLLERGVVIRAEGA